MLMLVKENRKLHISNRRHYFFLCFISEKHDSKICLLHLTHPFGIIEPRKVLRPRVWFLTQILRMALLKKAAYEPVVTLA